MNLPKISKVLHYAADHCLAKSWSDVSAGKEQYSCLAISEALSELLDYAGKSFWKSAETRLYANWISESIFTGLHNMGLTYQMQGETDVYDVAGKKYAPLQDRQGARYLWLKWCALMAEEQGE